MVFSEAVSTSSLEGSQPPNDSSPMFGVLLTVAYDGSTFSGYARQRHARTIAGELDNAVRAVDPRASLVRGASRTDAGVHALGQRVAFDASADLPPRAWAHALQLKLPTSIAITRAAKITPAFEPRHHGRRKRYRYVVLQSQVRDPFLEGRAWRVPKRLNHHAMSLAAAQLKGEHDFAAFRGAQDDRQETVRHLFSAEVHQHACDPRCLEIVVEGDRFLYHMMRIISGTLVDIGRGRFSPSIIERAFESRARHDLGMTAPPYGLFLDTVELESEGADAWPGTTIDDPPTVA